MNDDSAPTPVLARLADELVRHQRDGVVVQDAEGRILDFNEAALEVLSMTADQLRGVSSLDDRWQAITVAGEPVPGDQHPAMRALATGQNQLDVPLGVRSGEGTLRWLRVDSMLLDDAEHGRIVVSQFSDRTTEHAARARTAEALDRLQRHVLPTTEVDVAWLRAEHRYENVTAPLDVGGDFLDVFELDDGSVAFFIGDVAGHDLDAVATMVIARHTLRAAGLHLRRTGRILRWLHDTLVATPDTVFCTALFGVASPHHDGSTHVRLANGGHPPPVVVRADGQTETLSEHGRLLGAPTAWREPPEVEVQLQPGDRLLLYTDGLLENQRPRWSPEDLHREVAARTSAGVDLVAIVDDLLLSSAGEHRDDTAALMMTFR